MKYIITINDKNYEVDVEKGEARVMSVSNRTQAATVPLSTGPSASAPVPLAADKPAASPSDGTAIVAPMPGTILSIMKKPGDYVKAGDVVLILEAMKMENEIVATAAGTISQILVSKGAMVTTGESLVLIG